MNIGNMTRIIVRVSNAMILKSLLPDFHVGKLSSFFARKEKPNL